ncbi:DUF6807 family protein [Haloferula sp.]|uniref:DUF6807 family protein n=1 Tax=Haloferula sp. TaxID=2497595 RepID=UPI003C7150FC
MKPCILLFAGAFLAVQTARSELALTGDFTDPGNRRAPIYNFWTVRNEIPAYPNVGPQKAPKENTMNCIRLLGGWSVNGVPDRSEDVCYWDDAQGKYAYRWAKLTERIDAVMSEGHEIHQLVLDNVPWDFQRGFSFGSGPDDDYPAANQVTTYGNSLPPSDPLAWSDFIKAAMNKLVETYGLEQVEKWRFRIGTESDYYPHHWAGSKTDFFNHYRNTANAVLSVLPNAKLGAHFLGAGGNGRYGPEFVTWCAQNNVKYDFIGMSYYPFYTESRQVDVDRVYEDDLKPFIDAPGWNPNARLEFPEYSIFTERDDDGFNMGVGSSHGPAFVTRMAKMMYENSIMNVYSWGDHTKDPTHLALATMLGKDRYAGGKSGSPSNSLNRIDGIYAADPSRTSIDALIYSYNENPAYIADETVKLSFTIPVPTGEAYEYRVATYDQDTNAQQLFVKKYPLAGKWVSEGGWVTNRIRPGSPNQTDKNGYLSQILEEPGKTLWKNEDDFDRFERLQWSGWNGITTVPGNAAGTSKLELSVQLSSFSFQKIEFRKDVPIDPWISLDLGTPPVPGHVSGSQGVYTVESAGDGVGGTADECQFVYQVITGDCEITARVRDLIDTDPGAGAGVMIRGNRNANSKNASILVTSSQGLEFNTRLDNGSDTTKIGVPNVEAPRWVKITRVGNLFTGFHSSDGLNWSSVGSETIGMGQTVHLGLVVSSKVNEEICSATFDKVRLLPPTSVPVADAGSDQSVLSQDGVSANVELDGSGSFSANGEIVSWQWEEGGVVVATGANATVSLAPGSHTLTLAVTDDAGVTGSDTVVVMVEAVILGDPGDASPISNGNMGSTASDASFFAGRAGSGAGVNRSPVFVFKLPDLGPEDNPFSTASFAVDFTSHHNGTVPTANLDLYGLPRVSTSPIVVASDYFGDGSPDAAATLVQDGMFTPLSAFGVGQTTPAGDANLVAFLNEQYAGGAGALKYVFLRLSNDAAMNNNVRYVFTSTDGALAANGGSGDPTIRPQIRFTLGTPPPEPPDGWTVERKNHPTQKGEIMEIREDGDMIAQFVFEGDAPAKPHLSLFGVDGEIVTQDEPDAQFPHHRGVFIGWDEIVSPLGSHDLWHMDTGRMSTAEIEKVVIEDDGVSLLVRIDWMATPDDPGERLLTEWRTISISRPEGVTQVDTHCKLEAARALNVGGDLQHAGFHFRAHDEVSGRTNETRFMESPAGLYAGNDLEWSQMLFGRGARSYGVGLFNAPGNPVEELSQRTYGRFGYYFSQPIGQGESLALDYRVRLFEATSTSTSDLVTYEAEDATLGGGSIEASSSDGYTGSGYVDFVAAGGEDIEWDVTVDSAGEYSANFRYSLLSGNRPLELKVNGVTVVPSLGFPATGGWTIWGLQPVMLSLNSGANTVRLTSIGSSGANIDHLGIDQLLEGGEMASRSSNEQAFLGYTQWLQTELDSELDGMVDSWELGYFGSLNRDGTGDEDRDGSTDLEEHVAGTNPKDPQSFFRIKEVEGDDTGGIVIRWNSVPGRSYRAMKSSTLEDDWTPLSDPIPGTGGVISVKAEVSRDERQGFYRIEATTP